MAMVDIGRVFARECGRGAGSRRTQAKLAAMDQPTIFEPPEPTPAELMGFHSTLTALRKPYTLSLLSVIPSWKTPPPAFGFGRNWIARELNPDAEGRTLNLTRKDLAEAAPTRANIRTAIKHLSTEKLIVFVPTGRQNNLGKVEHDFFRTRMGEAWMTCFRHLLGEAGEIAILDSGPLEEV